jgi:hypothetical protein
LKWYLLYFPSNLSLSFAPPCWEPSTWEVGRPPIKSGIIIFCTLFWGRKASHHDWFYYIVHFLLGIGWTEGLKWRKSWRHGLYIFGRSKYLGGGWEIEIEKFLWSFIGFPLVGPNFKMEPKDQVVKGICSLQTEVGSHI